MSAIPVCAIRRVINRLQQAAVRKVLSADGYLSHPTCVTFAMKKNVPTTIIRPKIAEKVICRIHPQMFIWVTDKQLVTHVRTHLVQTDMPHWRTVAAVIEALT